MITDIISLLRRDEGVRLKPYVDTVGKVTIGVGRNLTDVGISPDECDLLLQNDLDKVSAEIASALPWAQTMDPIRYAVLASMVFNMGLAGTLAFRDTLGKMQAGDWAAAAEEMLKSRWAEQVGDRAVRLSLQLTTGEWT